MQVNVSKENLVVIDRKFALLTFYSFGYLMTHSA